jgi:uncharacterized membrane protein
MKYAQLRFIKLFTVMLLAIVVSVSITHRNAIIPIIAIAVAFFALRAAKSHTTEILADERDTLISGNAARLAIQIYAFIALFPMLILYTMRDQNPFYEPVAATLAYSVCILMVIYTGVYRFYNRIVHVIKKDPYLILAVVVVILTIATLRLMSGEDGWVCSHGTWVMHGKPSFPQPTALCK